MTHDDLARLQEEPTGLDRVTVDRYDRFRDYVDRWEPRPCPTDWNPDPRSTR